MGEFWWFLGYLLHALAHPAQDPILWAFAAGIFAILLWGPLTLVSVAIDACRKR